jgi:hypothetical protein
MAQVKLTRHSPAVARAGSILIARKGGIVVVESLCTANGWAGYKLIDSRSDLQKPERVALYAMISRMPVTPRSVSSISESRRLQANISRCFKH